MNLSKCDNCGNRNIMCFSCKSNKHYREAKYSHDNYIRNKAIEDFAKRLLEVAYEDYESDKLIIDYADAVIIAEQMKGGAE